MAKAPEQLSVNVPTMDDFNALKAQVDNHETRITALEHSSTGSSPSPDGTTALDPNTTITDGDGRKFKLTGPAGDYKIDCNGDVTGGKVIRLYAKNRMCYQENFNHDWWYAPLGTGPINSADDWIFTQNPTTGGGGVNDAPAQAKAHGFTELTYGPDIKMDKNWFPWVGKGNLAGSGLTVNSDGSIRIRGGDGNNWNAQLSSCIEQSKPPGNGQGVCFGGGGYFEAEFYYENPCGGWYQGAPGWPAWWGGAMEASTANNKLNPNTNIECDFLESMTKNSSDFNHGLIQWWNGVMNGAGEGGIDSRCYLPAGTRSDVYHRYGWLWVMATDTQKGFAQAYFDDQPVGPKYEWVKYQVGMSQGEQGNTKYSAVDRQHLQLLLGTGPENPMTVKRVRVWQGPGKWNVGTPAA